MIHNGLSERGKAAVYYTDSNDHICVCNTSHSVWSLPDRLYGMLANQQRLSGMTVMLEALKQTVPFLSTADVLCFY